MFNNQKRTCALLAILLLTWISIYSQDVINKSAEKYFPEFHFFPSIDPTGLSYYGGKYLLNWGTAVSKDLVHWEMTEYGTERNKMIVGIFGGNSNFNVFGPNSPFQSHVVSIESGSMVVDRNNTTGLSQNDQPPLIAFQSRSIAFSMDTAKTWIKSEFPPKIENSAGTGDPKVFWYEPDKKWILLMGGTNTQKIKFFSSQDMKNWEYLSEFGPWGAVNRAWNCVDFFPLAIDGNPSNTKWVLVISVQTCNGQYFVGDFDGISFKLNQQFKDELPGKDYFNTGWEKAFWVDWGTDFYAARSWSNYAPDEKRNIWVGWMGNHMYRNEPVFGIISVPRSLELKIFPEGIRFIQNPIKELESLRKIHKVTKENTFEGIWQPKKFKPGRNAYELVVEFENISAEEFGLNLCVGDDEKTVVGYNTSEEKLYVDRRRSGYDEFSRVFPCVSSGPMKKRTDITKLHIFIDKCSVEVFGNNGETTISSKIYPDQGSLGIEVFSNHGEVKVKSMELWELDSIDLY